MTRLGLSVLACALFVTGCGGVSVNDLKTKDIDALCDRLVRCGAISSKAVCVAAYSQFLDDKQLKAGVANGSIKYDDGKAGDCIDALSNESCDASSKDARVQPQACTDAIKGNRKQGEMCYFGGQCTSGSCTPPQTCTMACCAGTCDMDPPAAVAVGQSCEAAPCVDGAYCDATAVCAALIPEGQACQSSFECSYGTVCAGTTTMVCTKAPKVGDPCLVGTGGNACVVTGLRCDSTMHCAQLLDPGATCDPQNNLCKQDLLCDATSLKCTTLPTDGQPCTQACSPPDRCVIPQGAQTGTCMPLLSNGSTCTSSDDCASGFCDTGATNTCIDEMVCA
jgi:hypothetical protein